MALFVAPQSVTQNIARAKSLLKRDDPIRALEALITGLELYEPAKLMGKVRFELEVLIQECVNELDRQPKVREMIGQLSKTGKGGIKYAPGKEKQLLVLLPILRKGLLEIEKAKERGTQEVRLARQNMLREKGLNCLKIGDAPKGKAALRQLADEFGEESGIHAFVGATLFEYKFYLDAVDFLEHSIEAFPKEPKAYGAATACYAVLLEYEKAEAVYMKAIREFGKHPKTMLNLAKLYIEWNKKDKAYEAARAVVAKDPNNEEAKAIVAKYE